MPFVQVADVADNMKLVSDTKQKISELAQPMSVFAEKGSVLVTLQGSIGRVAITQYGAFVDRTVLIFEDYKTEIDNAFWAYIVKQKFIEEAKKAPGGTIKTITKEVLSNFDMMLPSYDEQVRLGAYFQSLDYLITLHQWKCKKIQRRQKNDWEQRKLGDLTERVQKNDGRMDLPTLTISAENGWMDQVDRFSGNIAGKEQKNYTLLHKGELSYNHGNSKLAKYGAVFELKDYKEALVPRVYHSFRMLDDNDPAFIEYLFATKIPDIELGKLISSGARMDGLLNIGFDEFMGIPITVPNTEEQHKISEYFRQVDELITLHQRKCDETQKLKKYMLQKMFPKNGATVPEIRFSGFTEDWEQRKFCDFTWDAGKRNKENLDLVPYAITNEHGFIPQSEAHDEFGYMKDTDRRAYNIVEPNSFAYNPARINVGSLGYYEGTENVIVSSLYEVFKTAEYVDDRFLWQWLKSPELPKWIGKLQEGSVRLYFYYDKLCECVLQIPSIEEQRKISKSLDSLDHLITLHQCKPYSLKKMMGIDWEQRKLETVATFSKGSGYSKGDLQEVGTPIILYGRLYTKYETTISEVDTFVNEKSGSVYSKGGEVIIPASGETAEDIARAATVENKGILLGGDLNVITPDENVDSAFLALSISNGAAHKELASKAQGKSVVHIHNAEIQALNIAFPSKPEQSRISGYFANLDHLITLHQREVKLAEKAFIYTEIQLFVVKEITNMAELEALIEQKLIDQLVYGDSQWTYRQDLKTEADLWNNFRYILEQNNKDRLNGEPLTDAEFDQVKNQLQFSSFYKAGEWLVGENGKVMVHVQRDTEKLHLVVMNHEHIAGGSSVYEVINQYQALDTDGNSNMPARDRRFDVTLMINGLPMIHIELKNKQHPYMDGFRQIKKYIGEGKFTGIFSAVQMFVVSNGVDTKYFAAASDRELNDKFLSGWVDNDNNPVTDYLDFAKSVLRIPQAHEMIARYTVLDEDAKRLIILRPYQIHAIEAIREASKNGKSGFVWHTTGSGKTLTSYKATRNLLMDIPSLDKTIFLIDRKDLDTQTTQAFQAYANNDLIDVDETDNVFDLKNKLKSDDRQVIVTTIQKLQILITKRLKEGTPEYDKIKNRRIAFVVDECHRAVTPNTKRLIERFFGRSLWYGFTGTPRFAENPYPQMGDLPRTTEDLYGERLHRYTIQNAIHDNAVLGFQVEHNGPKDVSDETDVAIYDNETHMLSVLEIILNRSFNKLGFQNGKGKTYEGLLTVSSIQLAQKYYDLLTRVKNGETSLVIDEKIRQVLPDFPKFAITYSVSENAEGSQVNQQKMQKSLDDYNGMFGTKYDLAQIQGYNANLNKRLARKDHKYDSRNEQLDLVIVVDRLLTGFDAPCMSTIFIDRQPMGPHDLIQAFSRTNRIFDKNKVYGQIVTFQAPVLFKEAVDTAVKLYSAGGTKDALMAEWDEVEPAFCKSLAALKVTAETPADIPGLSKKEKKIFVKMFQEFDRLFSQLKAFTVYDESMLEEYGITQQEYDDYAGHYKNVVEELKDDQPDKPDDPEDPPIDSEYELMAYSNTKIDYEYIINLIQNIVTPENTDGEITPEERQKKIEEVKQYVEELRKENPKVADIMSNLIDEIEADENKYKGQSILNIIENTKEECIDKVITDFCVFWYASKEEVMYAATHYRNGEIPNESAIKATIDFTSYKAAQERALPKFKYYAQMMAELKKTLDEEIKPLITR